ncbi:hypothetical protein E3N88_15032 [Mikania micrantha]|uniref:Uncharacterized protein n=1 Tax=Mikania micrantha TaxID=192012 RepID=A0A5N6P3F1_9ASTR|nr:hypothetical protein E3N88_15032 [Mikania micrantha]
MSHLRHLPFAGTHSGVSFDQQAMRPPDKLHSPCFIRWPLHSPVLPHSTKKPFGGVTYSAYNNPATTSRPLVHSGDSQAKLTDAMGKLTNKMRKLYWKRNGWLDPGVCPIYKHTESDNTGGVNEVKVLLESYSQTLMLCKQSDQHDYHPRYRAPGTFRPTGASDPTPPARGVTPCGAEQEALIVLLADNPFAGRIASPLDNGDDMVRMHFT